MDQIVLFLLLLRVVNDCGSFVYQKQRVITSKNCVDRVMLVYLWLIVSYKCTTPNRQTTHNIRLWMSAKCTYNFSQNDQGMSVTATCQRYFQLRIKLCNKLVLGFTRAPARGCCERLFGGHRQLPVANGPDDKQAPRPSEATTASSRCARRGTTRQAPPLGPPPHRRLHLGGIYTFCWASYSGTVTTGRCDRRAAPMCLGQTVMVSHLVPLHPSWNK